MTAGKIIQIFQDVDMRQSFDGLYFVAKKEKVDIKTLGVGEYVVFFNTAKTYLKLAAANNVIAARRMERGRFYDLGAIVGVVRAFHNTGEMRYEVALKDRLVDLLARKKRGVILNVSKKAHA